MIGDEGDCIIARDDADIMGFDVISEGVEEEAQLDTLRSIGCDYIQGFIWGRPLSAEDALKLVEAS